jgi:enamine deaminase RidA (YjgF/YER057c/UK114 family)
VDYRHDDMALGEFVMRVMRIGALAVAFIAAALIGVMTAPTRSVADRPYEWPSEGEGNNRCPNVDAEANLDALGIELPVPMPPPGINFELAVQTGNLLFLSGGGPQNLDGSFVTGKLGQDLTVEEGYEAARLTAINQLGVLKATLGDLNRAKRIIKMFGMVNATADFTEHPAVINGASDLLVDVFGDCGRHARSAVGMGSLPFGIPVEIEMIVEIDSRHPVRRPSPRQGD